MKLLRLHLENFRNIASARVPLTARRIFLLGGNGQGKSNFLEAAGMITALRSFRTHDMRPLIRHGEKQARLYFEIEADGAEPGSNPDTATLAFTPGKREAELNGVPIHRLADFIGHYPTVALGAEDIRLLRGAPGLRRRFLDLSLTVGRPAYLRSLSRYHRALRERNALLKTQRPSPAELAAFDATLAPEAVQLVALRREGLSTLNRLLAEIHHTLAGVEEKPELAYLPDCQPADAEAMHAVHAQSRERDLAFKTTHKGPHRDDWEFRLWGKNARDYASDGQQRGLAVALRLAQFHLFSRATGRLPVLLADDVLGELDPERRRGFWQALGAEPQIIASGTTPPEQTPTKDAWQELRVDNGQFTPA